MSYLDLLTDDLLNVIFDMVESKLDEDIYKLAVKVQDIEWDLRDFNFEKIQNNCYCVSSSGIMLEWLFDKKEDFFKPFHNGKVRFYNEETGFISKIIINPNYYIYLNLAQVIDYDNDDIYNLVEEPNLLNNHPENKNDITIFSIDLRED